MLNTSKGSKLMIATAAAAALLTASMLANKNNKNNKNGSISSSKFLLNEEFGKKAGISYFHFNQEGIDKNPVAYSFSISNFFSYCWGYPNSDSKNIALGYDQNEKSRFGFSSYPANNPSEDRMIAGIHEETGTQFAAVFDGHGGWQISDFSSRSLLEIIYKNITPLISKTQEIGNILIPLDKAINDSFIQMEDQIVQNVRNAFKLGFGDVAKVGSCVLVAIRHKNHLIIINCGDCRAVLGSCSGDSVFATIINRDHNARVPYEQLILQQNHPNESNLVICKNPHACYVKGRLQLTRSLGDCYLKYPEFNGSPDKGRSGGRYIPEPYTPPYVSHQPDIHHIRLQQQDQFYILGTDGLWDYLPAQEAVEIVRDGRKVSLPEAVIASKLVDRALEIAATESRMTLAELKSLPQGRSRRSRHDDTTAVVVFL